MDVKSKLGISIVIDRGLMLRGQGVFIVGVGGFGLQWDDVKRKRMVRVGLRNFIQQNYTMFFSSIFLFIDYLLSFGQNISLNKKNINDQQVLTQNFQQFHERASIPKLIGYGFIIFFYQSIDIYIKLLMLKPLPQNQDFGVGDRFGGSKVIIQQKQQQNASLPLINGKQLQGELNDYLHIQNSRQNLFGKQRFHSQRKIRPVVRETKDIKRICGHDKCRVCKRLKPSPDKKYLQFLTRKKQKPPLPPLPKLRIKTKQPEFYTQFQSEGHSRKNYRRVQSVSEAPPEDYSYQRFYKPKQLQSASMRRHVRFYSEQDQPPNKYVELNGKLYEIIDEQQEHPEQRRLKLKKGPVRNLINPIIDSRAVRYHQLQQRNKQREQLNRTAQKYFKYETNFYYQLRNQNQPASVLQPKKIANIQKMTMYRLKESTEQDSADLFKTVYNKEMKIANNVVPEEIEEKQLEVYVIKFPAISEIQSNISAYQSLTGQINIQTLRKGKNYSREYSDQKGKQFLYFGGFDHDKKERKGLGVLVTKKRILEGIWLKNVIIKGAQLKQNSLYKGQFKNNSKHGEGTCKWLNGEEYTGQWQNGLRNGQGFWSANGGSETYSGQWKGGQVWGYGEYYKKNMSVYKGIFENFVKHGHGAQEFTNGDKFQGNYFNGLPNGMGAYTWECGLKYQGQFDKGERQGKGRLKMPDIFQLNGQFQKERPHGICQLKLKNGDIFNGKYVFGEKYGYGKIQYGDRPYEEEGFWNHDVLQDKLNPSSYNFQLD